MERQLRIGGKYRHFKGNSYEVIALEPLVVYRALYGEGDVWVRPLAEFLDTVTRDGVTRQRFEEIDG